VAIAASDHVGAEAAHLVPAARTARQWALGAGIACSLCWLASREWYFSGWMDDDAFISFRYARNLVRGWGLVFNPGERVEGYTNFLWTVLLAALHRAGAGIPAAAQMVGALFSFLTIVLMLTVGGDVMPRGSTGLRGAAPWLGVIGGITLCWLEPWAAWAVGGLENPLGAFLVLAAFLVYFRSLETPDGRGLAAVGTLVALAALTHPSFALFGILIGAHLLSRLAGRGKRRQAPLPGHLSSRARPAFLSACNAQAGGAEPNPSCHRLHPPRPVRLLLIFAFVAPILLIGLPYLSWKYAYYGDLLPNTFRVRVGFHWAVLARGARYCLDVVAGLPLLVLTLIVSPVVLWRRAVRDARPWLLFAACLAYCCYAILIGGEAFPAFRLLIVVLPLQLLLTQFLIALLAERLVCRAPTALVPLAACGNGGQAPPKPMFSRENTAFEAEPGPVRHGLLALAVLLAGFVPGYLSTRVRVLDDAIETDRLGLVRTASLRLREHFPADILLAGSGAGVIPYYSEFRFLDTLGLTDAHIAARRIEDFGTKTAGHEKGDGRYVLERNPDVILFGSGWVSGFEPCFVGDYELVALPEFHERYEQKVLVVFFTPRGRSEEIGVYVPCYVRKGVGKR